MSTQQVPLTYEGILELFRETDRKFRETDRKFRETDKKFQETAKQLKKTQKEVGYLSSSVGRVVESMVEGNIVDKFQAFGYGVTECFPRLPFVNKKLNISGQIDLLLEDGDTAVLIEVKTTLETTDVRKHIERMEKYRLYSNAKGNAKKHYVGAVAGAVIMGDAKETAHENGLYVIVQSGDAVEIIKPPEGFKAKEW